MLSVYAFVGSFRKMLRRLYLFGVMLLVLGSMGMSGLAPSVAAVVAGPSSSVLYEFDSASDWHIMSGGGTLTTVSSPKTTGTGALRIDYDFNAYGDAGIGPNIMPPELPGLPRRLSLDIYGDGSWNVLYYEVRDATGEILRYWIGNLSFTGWQTMSVDLGTAVPVSGLNGNADKVLDLPVSLSQILIWRNPGATKLVSSVYVDHMVYEYDPVGATIDTPTFVPSVGNSTTVRTSLADQGTFTLKLLDEAGRIKNFSGTAGNGTDWSSAWNGRDDSSTLMTGSVRALFSVTRNGATASYAYPYFAGLPARVAGAGAAQRGINSFMTQWDTINRSTAATLASEMEAAYVGMAREEFEWKRIEPSRNFYDWAKFDQTVALDAAHGISILGKLVYGSPWNNTAPAGTSAAAAVFYPPSNIQDYVNYAVATVHRYKDRVHYWEIWNEENQAGFWMPSPNAAAYTQLLKATYAGVKAEDPTATVVLGGLSTGPDASFLQGIHDNGGWSSFDVLAIHSYVTGTPVGSAYERWITGAKSVLASYGSKPIWITEFGWSSFAGSGGTTTSDQKLFLEQAYEIAYRAGVAGIFWYELQNRGNGTTSSYENYGVLNLDMSAKPAYDGLKCADQAIYAGSTPACSSPVYPDSTFVGTTPTRILDTRIGLGLSGTLVSTFPRTFHVSGNLGGTLGTVVPSNAVAVVGNLTVTGSNSAGYVYLGPDSVSSPSSSTINFPAGDNRANGVTVPLDANGCLSAVFIGISGRSTHLVFDVTGYYLPGDAGSFFQAVAPARLLDSRTGTGVPAQFISKQPQTFMVKGRTDSLGNVIVPADAIAVTGNLTITNASSAGYAYIGPVFASLPGSSSINAPPGDNRANNVTVALDSNGALSVVYVGVDGSHADLIFDVAGYFTKSGGWRYVPVVPTRLLDSRYGNGLGGVFQSRAPRAFAVLGRWPIPAGAMAVTGNLTVTSQTAAGYGFMAASAPAYPTSSTINFPVGDNRANGVTLQLSSSGTLDIVYGVNSYATTNFIFDVSGYFH
jgi:hypothetical protein